MGEFLSLLPPPAALDLFLDAFSASLETETVATEDSLGRISAADIVAPHALPSFSRSTVDGYAVRAKDTHGASEGLPAFLTVVGEVQMGTQAKTPLGIGECAIIHTGGMLPADADAVVMVEQTQQASGNEIEVFKAAATGQNVLKAGEDVETGALILSAGRKIRPAEIGGLMAMGLTEISVTKPPTVGILSSGDEVIPPAQDIGPGQVRDINSYTLRALVEQHGGIANNYPIIPDNPDDFRNAATKALAENDVVIFTAGSSVSVRDLTAETIDNLGDPGVLVHGVNVRPGKPTILAVADGKPVIGLPGNPVSALVIANIFVTATIEKLSGLATTPLKAQIPAKLMLNLSSQSGREDWIAVKLTETPDGYVADPVFGKSNLIFTLTRADGLMKIHADANGIEAGNVIDVYLL